MSGNSNHIPLGRVKTYREGFLRLQGWIAFSVLAFFTAGLVVMYELLVINVEDQDFRDMLFDYRTTRAGMSYQHKHFANGHLCCHLDPAVYGQTNCSVSTAMRAAFAGRPDCPPAVYFTCPDLTSPECNQLRGLLYPAAGLDNITGLPSQCSTAGRVMLRAQQAGGYVLSAAAPQASMLISGVRLPDDLVLNPASFDAAAIQAFVQQASAAADPMFFLPRFDICNDAHPAELQLTMMSTGTVLTPAVPRDSHAMWNQWMVMISTTATYYTRQVPLSKAVTAGGAAVPMVVRWQPPGNDKWGEFGWPWELWPWPPSAGCSNTGQPAATWLEGNSTMPFSPLQTNLSLPQPTFAFAALSQPLVIPQYKIIPAGAARGAFPTQWHHIGPFATSLPATPCPDPTACVSSSLPGSVTGADVDAGKRVTALALTGVNLTLGLVAPMGGCEAWQVHKPGVVVRYGRQVWQGKQQELAELSTQQLAALAANRVVDISLHDVAEPRPLALPHYTGEVYVYAALALGGVWLVSTAPLLIMLGVLVLNVQRNRGLPIFFYKYMRQYRGW